MSKLKITELSLNGVKIIEPMVFPDNRGCSFESYSTKDYKDVGIKNDFVLDYQALNLKKNTLRGIHCQVNPHSQTKLVRVLNGEIMDVVVDLRKDSPTFKQWLSCCLSGENNKQILIPSGFGHAFITLSDKTSVLYKFDDYYYKESVRTIKWNDPEISIEWKCNSPIISASDDMAMFFSESDIEFFMEQNE